MDRNGATSKSPRGGVSRPIHLKIPFPDAWTCTNSTPAIHHGLSCITHPTTGQSVGARGRPFYLSAPHRAEDGGARFSEPHQDGSFLKRCKRKRLEANHTACSSRTKPCLFVHERFGHARNAPGQQDSTGNRDRTANTVALRILCTTETDRYQDALSGAHNHRIEMIGAEGEIRTRTPLRALPPQGVQNGFHNLPRSLYPIEVAAFSCCLSVQVT